MHTVRHIIQCKVDNKKKKKKKKTAQSIVTALFLSKLEKNAGTLAEQLHTWQISAGVLPTSSPGGDSSDPQLFLTRSLSLIFPSPSLRIFPIFPQGKIWRRLVNFGREDYPSLEVNCLISSMSCAAKCLWIHQDMSVVPLPDGGWILRLTERLRHVFIPPTSGT